MGFRRVRDSMIVKDFRVFRRAARRFLVFKSFLGSDLAWMMCLHRAQHASFVISGCAVAPVLCSA